MRAASGAESVLRCRSPCSVPSPIGSTVVGSSGSKANNHVIVVGYALSARSIASSACSVAVSCKPPMLVTRARLPACALALATPPRFAVVHMQHVPVGSSVVTSLGGEVTKHVVITEPTASSRDSTSSAGARHARFLWC